MFYRLDEGSCGRYLRDDECYLKMGRWGTEVKNQSASGLSERMRSEQTTMIGLFLMQHCLSLNDVVNLTSSSEIDRRE
jgi:hypothetical protein